MCIVTFNFFHSYLYLFDPQFRMLHLAIMHILVLKSSVYSWGKNLNRIVLLTFSFHKKIEVNNLILRCQMRRDSLSIQAANNQTITPISDPTFHTNLSVFLLFRRFYLFQIAFPFHCIFQF